MAEVSTEKLIEAANLVSQFGSIREASRSSGIPRSTLRDRYKKAVAQNITGDEQCVKVANGSDKYTLITHGTEVKTVEDALQKADIDMSLWEVEKAVINSWPTTIKNAEKNPEQVFNWQVKVFLRRRAPKAIQQSIQELVAEFSENRPHVPAVEHVSCSDPHMLELSLYDAHFGKLCWGEETGHDYDLKIAHHVFLSAIDELLHLSSTFEIDRILFPIGHDFFQANNWLGTTAKGTRVDSVDDRFQRVFKVGAAALTDAVKKCIDIAPIEIVWVPGNHDPETSWYLVEWLSAYFKGNDNVSIDTSPAFRKYRRYGDCLIGMTHGNEEKHDRLPLIMAAEHPEWSECKFREIHIGHYHKKKELSFMPCDEYEGTRVRVLPSLSGTDSWHFRKGFVKNQRAAEALIWSPNKGHVGYFSTNVA